MDAPEVRHGMAAVAHALANERRIEILLFLRRRPAAICELSRFFGMSEPSVSRHVKVLREANLVEAGTRQEGLVRYWLKPPKNHPRLLLSLLADVAAPELRGAALDAADADMAELVVMIQSLAEMRRMLLRATS